jgi:hypothetical protein
MTEEEWLLCTDLVPMLDWLGRKVSDRKMRLCACARNAPFTVNPSYNANVRRAVEVAEQYADGLVSESARARAHELAARVVEQLVMDQDFERAAIAAQARDCCRPRGSGNLIWQSGLQDAFDAVTCGIIRDIFGNPFRPVTGDPAWLTSTVVQLAQGMYDSRDFSVMPILADALQDAGCDNADILTHCRDAKQVHVRGCWVVDLVMGKS